MIDLLSILLLVTILVLWYYLRSRQDKPVIIKPATQITTMNGKITYSRWYRLPTCPNCHVVIKDRDQARYYDRCCTECGYSNGSLFDVVWETVRDVYCDGKYIETQTKTE